jgi:hypothetical protein
MIAWTKKPRWVFKKVIVATMLAFSALLLAGPVFAEIDVVMQGDKVTLAGRSQGDFYFGSADHEDGVIVMPLEGWVRIRGAGSGTGRPNGAGSGTGDQTNGAGSGTGGQTNGAGSGTGLREIRADWGAAAIALGCNVAVVAILENTGNGTFVQKDFAAINTDICIE